MKETNQYDADFFLELLIRTTIVGLTLIVAAGSLRVVWWCFAC